MGYVSFNGCELFYEEASDGVPIPDPPFRCDPSTWGAVIDQLTRVGRAPN